MTDRHYAQIKNQPSAVPSGSIDLGTTTNRYGNLYLSGAMILGNVSATEASLNVPKISSISFPNSATAGSPTGGETVTITGSGFLAGASVYVANILVSVSTVVSSTTITFTSPVKSDGNYSLSVVNTDGGSASFIPGITYSDFPAFSTAAGSLGTSWEGNAVSSSVAATSDSSVSFSVTSGSLPSGLSLSNTGNITGTLANVMSGNTTYNFTVTASDQEQQKTSRNFSYTVTGDTLTFGSPANNTSYNFNTNMAISNISLAATSELGRSITYTANVLPAGLTLTGNTISGSPSVTANSSSLITASTLTKSANIQLNFSVTPLTVTVNYLLVAGGGAGARDENFGAGGGGAGGVINGSMAVTVGSGVTTVTIGAGGTGSLSGSGFTAAQGANTTLTGGMVVTAYGGGRGGGSNGGYWWDTHNGQGGGSGGGAASSGYGSVTQGKGVYPGSTYVSATRQGYDGAIGNPGGGGGGGAGSVGYANAYGGSGTNTFSSILSIVSAGSGGYIAGGGAGGVNSGTPQAPGGSGGGGAGGRDLYNLPSNGSTNTGSGGGGGRGYDACAGGNGGSGIAILYFPTGTTVSVTGSPATYTSGGNTYYKFTSSGTITF